MAKSNRFKATTGDIVADSLKGNSWPLSRGYVNITGAIADSDYTALDTEYSCKSIRFGTTGWTGGHNFIVPTTVAEYNFINACGQIATVKTSGGTGIAVANGKSAILLCDGTNVVRLTADV